MFPANSTYPEKAHLEYQKQSMGSLPGFQMTKLVPRVGSNFCLTLAKLFGGFQGMVGGELGPWLPLDW